MVVLNFVRATQKQYDPTEDEIRANLSKWAQAINYRDSDEQADVDSIIAMYSRDAVFQTMYESLILQGHEQCRKYYEDLFEVRKKLHVTIIDPHDEDKFGTTLRESRFGVAHSELKLDAPA